MIIDSHVHLGRNSHITANVDQLLKSMDAAKIDKSLVIAGKLNDASNEWMLEQVAPHTDRLLAVVVAHPEIYKYANDPLGLYGRERQQAIRDEQEEVKKIVDWYGEGKIVAAKFYVGYYHYYPSDAYNYLYALNKLGCPALFHSGDCLNSVKQAKLKYAHPLHIDDVAVDYPNMNFIIAHIGSPWWRDTAEVVVKNSNVYTDISGFVYGVFLEKDKNLFLKAITEYLEIAGSGERLLFGTDWPISNQQSYIDCIDNYIGNGLTPQYLTDNTKKAFKL